MNWDWPESVVQEVAERRAIFVLGAGASMASSSPSGARPPSWVELLEALANGVVDPRRSKSILSTIRRGRLLEAAEIIDEALASSEISQILRNSLQKPNFYASEIHRVIIDIDPKIVVTTNFDDILDRYVSSSELSGGYVICKHTDSHAVNDLRSGQRCIFKMHGCITDPTQLVLTKNSYFRARRDYSAFYAVLDAVFLTSTIIFIGTSMDDPDLQLLLENTNISAPSDYHHYALMPKPQDDIYAKILLENYNVKIVPYAKGNHEYVVDILKLLEVRVQQWRDTH